MEDCTDNSLFISDSSQGFISLDHTEEIPMDGVENADQNIVVAMIHHPMMESDGVSGLSAATEESDKSLIGQELKRQLLGVTAASDVCGNVMEAATSEQGLDNSIILKDEPVQQMEEVGQSSEVQPILVKEEPNIAAAPQQFIILARSNDGGEGQVTGVDGQSTKYLRFEGADGMTYVLALQDVENTLLANTAVASQPSQQLIPLANVNSAEIQKKLSAASDGSGPSMINLSSSSSKSSKSSSSSSTRAKSSHNASVDGINQAWFTTRDDKDALHNEGLKWKQGQWTKEEVQILEENINSYCKEHNIKDPSEVIFERSKEERKDFYRTVALGIQRPLFSVYRRVTRMYDRKNHRGKYTPSEIKNLRVLRAKHGNDWAAIGVALGRSASSVKDKCRLMKDNCNSGKWYPEEEARLAAAVHKLTGIKPSESVTSGLSWAIVAEQVGTRSEKQCRTKWLNYLNWKQQGGADWTREDDNLLIERVSKLNVLSDSEIDWVSLSQDWASVRSPQWLRGKWWALKRHIPEYNKLTYQTLLEHMRHLTYWNMKPKPIANVRQTKTDIDTPTNTSSEYLKYLKGVIPVSVGALSDGSLSLTYCSADEEGGQAFEVLQSWTPQILSQAGAESSAGETSHGILSNDGSHIIVQTLASNLEEGVQLGEQHQVVISAAGVPEQDGGGTVGEAMTIQVDGEFVHAAGEQDLHVLTADGLNSNTFPTEGEEIVTVTEFQPQVEEGRMMSQDVFETVTSESGADLVMGVTSPSAASSLMTGLKDPILMSSSDVDCEKSQSAVQWNLEMGNPDNRENREMGAKLKEAEFFSM